MLASLALSNLRAVTILVVLAFHSILAYLASLPAAPYRFGDGDHRWQAFPIVDQQRWIGFDLFCAWQYVSMMALMFFLSGLFVAPSLARKGSGAFLGRRLLRIGAPLVLVILFLTPLAYYPAYRTTGADAGFAAFQREWLALPFWPPGPQWFLSLLLIMNVLVAALHRFAPGALGRFAEAAGRFAGKPVPLFLSLAALTAIAYVPLALVFSPWAWTNVGPLGFETTRPLFYLAYFLAGVAIGARGLDSRLLASDGPLARHWAAWLAAAVAGFALWAGTSSLTLGDWSAVPLYARLAAALSVPLGGAAGCLFALAMCLRFLRARNRIFDGLSANAYGIYLLHYAPVVWMQFALLDTALPAVAKAAIVFGTALIVSWPLASAISNLPLGARIFAARRMRGT